jgi:hypothetical protein
MTKLMEALVVVGGLAALAYFMSSKKAPNPDSENNKYNESTPRPLRKDEKGGTVEWWSQEQANEVTNARAAVKYCSDISGNDYAECLRSHDLTQPTEWALKQLKPTDNHKEAPPSANLMLNQHVGAAKQLVASGGDLTDLIGMRKDAARAVMENPGQVKQTPLPPPNVGYVNAMKRQNLSSGKIIFNKL